MDLTNGGEFIWPLSFTENLEVIMKKHAENAILD